MNEWAHVHFSPSEMQTVLPLFVWPGKLLRCRTILQLVESFTSKTIQFPLLLVLFKAWSQPPPSSLPGVCHEMGGAPGSSTWHRARICRNRPSVGWSHILVCSYKFKVTFILRSFPALIINSVGIFQAWSFAFKQLPLVILMHVKIWEPPLSVWCGHCMAWGC